MIIEWMIGVGCGFVSWLATLLPSWDVPAWFVGLGDTFNAFFANFDGFGAWADWALIGTAVAAVLGAWAVVLSVKVILFVYHLLPFSGGGS